VVFYCQGNIFYLKNLKKDTSHFPRKSVVSIFRKKDFSDFSRKSVVSFFQKNISQVFQGTLFWTFQIKYISLAVKHHRSLKTCAHSSGINAMILSSGFT